MAEDVSKELAGQIALGVDGIKSVDNQIEVISELQRAGEIGGTQLW